MENLIRCYEALTFPVLSKFRIAERYSRKRFILESEWTFGSPKEEASLRNSRQHFVDENLEAMNSKVSMNAAGIRRICHSPSGAKKAVVREISKAGNSKASHFLEIWSERDGRQDVVFDLTARNLHGPIYDDDRFGGIFFSDDEKHLFYISERRRDEGTSFFSDTDASKAKDAEKKGDADPLAKKGKGSLYIQSWGEQLDDKKESVLVVANIELSTIDVIPEDAFGDKSLCPAEFVVAGPNNLVGVVYDPKPFKLGAQFCINRRNRVYVMSLKFLTDGRIDKDALRVDFIESLNDFAVRNLRLSPDKKHLCFIASKLGGTHYKTSSMYLMNLETKELRTVIPETKRMDEQTKFAGLCGESFVPKRCFARDGDNLCAIFTSMYLHCTHIYAVDLEGSSFGRIRRLTDCSSTPAGHGSWIVHDVDFDTGLLLASWKDSLTPAELYAGYFPSTSSNVDWKRIYSREDRRPALIRDAEIHRLYPIEIPNDSDVSVPGLNALLLLPGGSKTDDFSVPLVCMLHGGPHSNDLDSYSVFAGVLLSLGFAVLRVNYRGSLGCGEDYVQALLGRIGTLDVGDCHHTVLHVLEKYKLLDPKRISLMGGSHGGFLVSHLAGQYPDFYKCVVACNPVTNLPAMLAVTDIPDWVYVESGLEYKQDKGPLSADSYARMMAMSPFAHIDKIRCPVLLQIGDNDLRVPPSQGYSMYYALKARGVEVELRHYADNHALGKADVIHGFCISSLLWIIDHVPK
ncbi:unnamed protein product [Notodromas monacha]|uniref:acylaminoacyl-peptidase n=1 Tax=Notodromas monacha TaxID=399045 RepID=A0A7R9GBH5_9CRUS|nr:unnamed protein product [Notodromas monacha]CAG0916367.1 unnamed protein product [Notodromas monacha]